MTGPTVAVAVCALLAACTQGAPPGADANTPGFTGTTIVRGNNSTLQGNTDATYQQQKWPYCLRC
ncbi:MAG TPA: hypothetical protein VFG62_00275 [Rhodopila sp.]|jgi:hypothetical protein|nr:hypothetical protein [Rhodopila sp.]